MFAVGIFLNKLRNFVYLFLQQKILLVYLLFQNNARNKSSISVSKYYTKKQLCRLREEL